MDPVVFVIFGASGDLTRRKLIPAIFNLFRLGQLPENFALLGVSRTKLSDEAFRDKVVLSNEHFDNSDVSADQKNEFASRLFYQPIDTSDVNEYAKVKERLEVLNEQFNTSGNYIFYLSTPPKLYATIPNYLAAHGLHCGTGGQADDSRKSVGYRRLVIEKPFGYDLQSAIKLNKQVKEYFEEEQVYRIDHYLGKETVQNLLVTRFANGIFEPLWNRNYIVHVQITSAEDIGVGNRGGYYDQSGAMRDMFQNHLLQVVAHVTMEPPIDASATAIRNEKAKLLQSIRPITSDQVRTSAIRGQYTASSVHEQSVLGYRQEEGVPDSSRTETFAAIKFFIDNWRWADVPFYVRTGKRLPTKVAEIVVTFRKPPQSIFQRQCLENDYNQLVMRIQPDEGLLLNFGMKVPGDGFQVKNVGMDFHYSDLAEQDVPVAYERLLLDCMRGDGTLYAHGDSVEHAWRFVDPIIDAWKNDDSIPVYGYPAGTWGPEAADKLIQATDLAWRNPCRNLTSDTNFCEL